ncbi:MAG: ABC transporter ATP-binding protein [Anaeroplasmataceae bacterium]|nr:ABC transporter ATP-binding protein [Anaeroplasmataceae bacterium]
MLEIKNVSKIYQTKNTQVEALKNVSLKFMSNGLYFILGKSGCGKSTLLNLIAGLDCVTSGEILLDGNDFTKFNSNQLNQYRNFEVGFVFQEFNLIPNLNVKENIALSLKMQGKKVIEEEILEVLKLVEMDEFIHRKINELSGGQKQRIAIARAIIKNPKIIIADEPTGALDTETSEQIFSLLRNLSQNHLIIVVSHDEVYAKKYADELVYLKDGCVEKEEKLHIIYNYDLIDKQSSNKSYLPFFTALKIGFSNFKVNILRLCILIFLSVISFTCLGVSIIAFQYNKEEFIVKTIADNGYVDPLAILSIYKKNESTWQQTTISPTFIRNLNEKLEGNYLGVYQGIGRSDSNFIEDVQIDYSGTYDALSLFSLSGITIINSVIQESLGYNIYGCYTHHTLTTTPNL